MARFGSTKHQQNQLSDNEVLDKNLSFRGSNPDHRVEVETIEDINDLYIDPDIQRGEEPAEINKIVTHFNEAALGTLTVAAFEMKGGGYQLSLVDGQQRVAALKRLGYKKPVNAMVHYGLTKAEAAQLFLDLNYRRSVGAWQRLKARITAEEPQALAIRRVVTDSGIRMGGVKGFMAIGVADKIYQQKDGEARLRWALQVVRDVYDLEGKGGCYDGRVIEAFSIIYGHYFKQVDRDRLVDKLRSVGGGVHSLIGFGHVIQSVNGGQIAHAIAQGAINHYNKHKHRNPAYPTRLPDLPRHRLASVKRSVSVDEEAENSGEAVDE